MKQIWLALFFDLKKMALLNLEIIESRAEKSVE
jgi:hypothetical protein